MHANKMRLNKLNDSVLTVNYTVENDRESRDGNIESCTNTRRRTKKHSKNNKPPTLSLSKTKRMKKKKPQTSQ